MEVSLAPHEVFDIGPVHVTSGHLGAFFVTAFLIIVCLLVGRKASLVPTRMQVILEGILDMMAEKVRDSTPKQFFNFAFALIATLFMYILVSNLFTVFPLMSNFEFHGHHMFTPSTAHFSQTLMLSIFTLTAAHLFAMSKGFFHHLNHFIRIGNFFKIRSGMDVMNAVIELFIGLLEIIGEFAKMFSLAARLFGNIGAHEIMILVIMGLSTYTGIGAPMPFYALGLAVAFIQALVFSSLCSMFVGATLSSIHTQHGEAHH